MDGSNGGDRGGGRIKDWNDDDAAVAGEDRCGRLSRSNGRQGSGQCTVKVGLQKERQPERDEWRRGLWSFPFLAVCEGRRILWCGCMRTISDWLALLGGGQPRPRASTLKTDDGS